MDDERHENLLKDVAELKARVSILEDGRFLTRDAFEPYRWITLAGSGLFVVLSIALIISVVG